jgi:predicted NBD/HSP70 family sugar kinase
MRAGRRHTISLSDLQKRIIWHLRVYGPTPRSQIAEALGQSNAAITRFSKELIGLGLIQEEEQLSGQGRGRPMVPLGVSGEGAYAAGATCHPGWLEVVLVDFAGKLLAQDVTPFHSAEPLAFANAVRDRLAALAGRLGVTQRRFLGLGVAVPGYLIGPDERRSVVPWLNGWHDVPLASFFDDALGMPVWIENDGTAAALAEYYQDRIVSAFRTALVFFLGHGVGGGLVAERDPYRGEFGNAGEIGRLFPGTVDRPSGIDLIATLQGHGVDVNDLAGLDALLSDHHPIFSSWMDRVAQQLQHAIASGVAWLDPGAIVISGSLPTPLLNGLVDRLGRWEDNAYRAPRPKIFASTLGSSAVCIGAGLVPIHAVTSRR